MRTTAEDIDIAKTELEKHRLIGRKEIQKLIPVSSMTLWRWQQEGLFPMHFNINGRSFWRLSVVLAAIDQLAKVD